MAKSVSVDCVCRRWVRQQKPVVEVKGVIDDAMKYPVKVYVWAASPMDRNQSFSGSGMPFANPEMAFGHNSVVLDQFKQSDFKVVLHEPNSFYMKGGSVLIPPTVYVKVVSIEDPSQTASAEYILDTISAPYRALNYTMPKDVKEKTDVTFYAGRDTLSPERTQYQILVDSSYPCTDTMATNFWGKKPPQ